MNWMNEFPAIDKNTTISETFLDLIDDDDNDTMKELKKAFNFHICNQITHFTDWIMFDGIWKCGREKEE